VLATQRRYCTSTIEAAKARIAKYQSKNRVHESLHDKVSQLLCGLSNTVVNRREREVNEGAVLSRALEPMIAGTFERDSNT
jgi:hypothetical protein